MDKHILSKYELRKNLCSHVNIEKIQFKGESIKREKEGSYKLKRGKMMM